MKKTFFVYAGALMVSAATMFAQSPLQKAQELLKAKEYQSALAPAVQAVQQNPKSYDALLLLGDVYDAVDQQDSAVTYYFKAYDREDDKPEVLKKLALAYSAVGKHQDALKIAQQFTKKLKNDPFSYLTLSQVYVSGSESNLPEFVNAVEKAQTEVFKAQKINSNLPDGFVALGDINFARKVYELAKDNYEEGLKRDPSLVSARAKLAESYFRLGNLLGTSKEDNIKYVNLSVQEWDKVTRADTNNVKAFFEKGKIQYRARQYKDAVPTLTRYAQLKPDGWLGRWYKAQSLFYILRVEKTLDTAIIVDLESSIKNIDSVKDQANLMLAEVWLLNKEFKKAAAKYSEIKASKGLPDLTDLNNYAKAAINGGDTTTAVTLYIETFQKYPKSACQNALPVGNILYNLRQYDRAIEIFRKRVDTANHCPMDANTARAYHYIGSSYFSQKEKADSAVAPLIEAIKLDSSALYSRNLLAQVYVELKKDKLAKEEFVKVTELGKGNPKAKNDVGNAFANLCSMSLKGKNFGELQKHAQTWTTNEPTDYRGFLYLAISYYQTDPALACKNYKEVLKLAPDNKDAKIQIEQLGCDNKPAADPKGGKKKGK